MALHQNLIAGEWTGGDAISNINPSDTNEVVGEYARGTAQDMKDAIAAAKAAAGIQEEANTWAGWQRMGYEVKHGSKALFGVDLIYGSKGDGAIYKARFFGASQVQPIEAM